MKFPDRSGIPSVLLGAFLTTMSLSGIGCRNAPPLLSFLDAESSLSFTHPPRWSVAFAEQNGTRYRYVTAPSLGTDTTPLSVTLLPPTAAPSADAVAQPYLAGASSVASSPAAAGASEWTFKDTTGTMSRLRVVATSGGRFYGAWVRGSEAGMKAYQAAVEALLASLRVEDPTQWPEERFGGTIARAPADWTRGSRFSNQTNSTMQFKTLPLAVDKGTDRIHGFVTVSKEPVPRPGDLEAFSKLVKERGTDTAVLLAHQPWPAKAGIDRADGYADVLRSGTTITSTRIRRWISVRNGVGLMLTCEARADSFDRLEPWCLRMAETIRLE